MIAKHQATVFNNEGPVDFNKLKEVLLHSLRCSILEEYQDFSVKEFCIKSYCRLACKLSSAEAVRETKVLRGVIISPNLDVQNCFIEAYCTMAEKFSHTDVEDSARGLRGILECADVSKRAALIIYCTLFHSFSRHEQREGFKILHKIKQEDIDPISEYAKRFHRSLKKNRRL